MAFSMTGSGIGRERNENVDITVFIKGVNHRYLQMNIRLPREMIPSEPDIRKMISNAITRGKIDVFVDVSFPEEDAGNLKIDIERVKHILKVGRALADDLKIEDGFTIDNLLKYPDVFYNSPLSTIEPEAIADILKKAVRSALDQFIAAKKSEGAHLTDDMRKRCRLMTANLESLKKYAQEQPVKIKARLEELVENLTENSDRVFDEGRLEQEIVLLAARSDITEEIVRLENHLKSLDKLIGEPKAVGKRGEFLIQEIHREISTIGAKSNDQRISDVIIGMKTETEKLREQIQNIE